MSLSEKIARRIADSFILRNLLIYCIMLSFNTGIPLSLGELSPKMMLIEAFLLTNSYSASFIHNLLLYRYLLKKRRYFLYALSVSTLLFVSSHIYSEMRHYFFNETADYPPLKWIAMYWLELIYYWAGLCVYLTYTYYRDRERLFHIEQEKKELELKQLNEQLNPHFLFNALNNIYSHLLVQSSSGKELILKLSELMRYVLDSSKKKEVPLEEEIAFIEHYIAFEQERLGKRCTVIYEKQVQTENTQIIPLILFTFIENAFKHGTTAIKPSVINIRLHAGDHQLQLSVQNDIQKEHKVSTRTGLSNVRKRLELLYPGQYELDIKDNQQTYIIQLKLNNLSCLSDVS